MPTTMIERCASLMEECEGVLRDLRHAALRGVPPAQMLSQVEEQWAARLEALAGELKTFLMRTSDAEVTHLMAHRAVRVRRLAASERGRRAACQQ
jgi:hypothetical protein